MTEEELISKWSHLPAKPPFILDEDKEAIDVKEEAVTYSSSSQFIENLEILRDSPKKFHLGLLPLPYIGDLRNGKIFLLMANPGLGTSDYKAEYEDSDYRQAVYDNLFQKRDREYPFFSLNPKYSWHGGFSYWEPRLRHIIALIRESVTGGNYQKALQHLSKNLVILELIPYHSKETSYQPNLSSSNAIRDYVHTHLIPRAKAGEITLVAMRRVKDWRMDKQKPEFTHDNIIIYDSGDAWSASLPAGSDAYKPIIDRLIPDYQHNVW